MRDRIDNFAKPIVKIAAAHRPLSAKISVFTQKNVVGLQLALTEYVETLILTTTMAGALGLAYGLNKGALFLLLRALRIDEPTR